MFHPKGPTFWELTRQALSSTRRGYDLLAPNFEWTPFRTPDAFIEAALEDVEPVEAAVDLCCGTGAGMRHLRNLTRKRLVGVDFSAGMLAEAEKLSADTPGEAALEFVQADVCDLDFEAEFDLAVCFGALGHLVGKDEDRFLESVYSILKPGGRFVFVTEESPPWWSRERWLAMGFNGVMAIRNLVWRPKFIMVYLTFLLPEIQETLERRGFSVVVRKPEGLGRLRVVEARKDI